MAYDINFPADDSYLSDFPAGDREQNRALKDDQIVNAGRLRGLTVGNENGQIPINNGTENTNLNAALLNGKESSYFATSNHTHTTATQSSNGYMSNADKKKLDGIASGAEVNQNAFANVKVGSTTIQSDAKQDTLELAAGTNISLVGDANNDKVTIGVTGKVASASQADNATNATNATKATQDKNGLQIDTTYLKRSGGTMGGALNLANGTLNLAGDDCYFGDQNIAGGFCLKGANGATNLTLINKDNVAQKASLSYAGGNLISSATIQGNLSGSATKATQDSAGQTINTTYVKGVTANNATLTITKGSGSTSTTTVNNVSNATNANNLVISGTSAHIKYGGGDVDENTAISQNKVNLLIGSWYSTGFRDLCSSGNPIRVAINHRNGNIKTTGNVTANGAMYSATPGTSDNSTRVATTAFVQSLINSLKGSIGGTIVASNLAQNGYVKFSNGLILQWGTFNWSQTIGGKQNFTYTVPFPIVFSSRKWCMPSIPKVVFGQNGANVQTTYYTNNGVYIHAETGSMQVCAMSAKFDYIAIGV
jgi:hypothetical protein